MSKNKDKIKYRNKRKKEIAIETGVSIGTLQTAHDKNTDGDALGYDKAIIVKDPTFDVNQKKRFQVVEKKEKVPMASVKGVIHCSLALTAVIVAVLSFL